MKSTLNIENLNLELRTNAKIGIVVAEYNKDITQGLLDGALNFLKQTGLTDDQVSTFWVSGAVEIPLVLKALSKKKNYIGLISLGCVIQGDTAHFDYVCKYITEGVLQVSLDSELPISFGILTTNNQQEATDRSKFPSEDNKGAEAAYALVRQINTLREVFQSN